MDPNKDIKDSNVVEPSEKGSNISGVEDTMHGFEAHLSTMGKGYYYSASFVGTMLATGLGLAAAVGGFSLAAPNLAQINAEIGPDPNIYWVSLVYTLTLAIGLLLVGRLSDLFGRRVRKETFLEFSRRRRRLIFTFFFNSGSSLAPPSCPSSVE
jgi:MFS family permease